jgi:hypothetical protein
MRRELLMVFFAALAAVAMPAALHFYNKVLVLEGDLHSMQSRLYTCTNAPREGLTTSADSALR